MSAGEAIDFARRKVTLRRWRAGSEIAVSCIGRKARLRTRKATTDAEVVWQCFMDKQYEVPTITGNAPTHRNAVQAYYEKIRTLGKTPLVIDCGANMGASPVWFDLRYPNSTIVAVEPARANIEILKENTRQRPNVSIVEAGIGLNDGMAFLRDQGGGHWGYQTSQAISESKIELVSLDSLLSRYLDGSTIPFILKIDIEGAEKGLFDRSPELLAVFPVIILEPHDFCMPGMGTASSFFGFHAHHKRDFLFHYENVFSLDMRLLAPELPL